MSEFTLPVPSWNDILQLEITGLANKNQNQEVELPTENGVLRITMLANGFRFQSADEREYDYQILKMKPQAHLPINLTMKPQAHSRTQLTMKSRVTTSCLKITVNT